MARDKLMLGDKEIVQRYVGEKLVYAKVKKMTFKLKKTTMSPLATQIEVGSDMPSLINKIIKLEVKGYSSYKGEITPSQSKSSWNNYVPRLYSIHFKEDLDTIFNLNGNFMKSDEITIYYY